MVVKVSSTAPLAYLGPPDRTRHQSHNPPDAGVLLVQHCIGKHHSRSNPASNVHINVLMEGLACLHPVEARDESEDCRVRLTLRRHHTVPSDVINAASAGHVALSGQNENVLVVVLGRSKEYQTGVCQKHQQDKSKHLFALLCGFFRMSVATPIQMQLV
ncbi:unnamed protein product [Camellia sinensis]